jgi:hypothetical protein
LVKIPQETPKNTRFGRVTQQRKTGSETSKKRASFAFPSLMRTERCAGWLWGGWQIRAFEEQIERAAATLSKLAFPGRRS